MQDEILFDLTAYLAPPIAISGTPEGDRLIIPEGDRLIIYVTGGKFGGPRLKVELLYMIYRGIAQLASGGLGTDPFPIRRAASFFASRLGKFAWLNSVQAIGARLSMAA
jgi:uncharacterized heparinase superfamily protein